MRWGITAVLMVVTCGLVAPASAFAEPPANDDFANREALEGTLPIEVVASNVGATKEEGEFIPGLAPAGHSVWYEWEATGTGWTTIGVCEVDFPAILGIFTGSKVNELTSVITGNPNHSEGPDCPFTQRQYTFKAKAGTKYEIAVDGNSFYAPGEPMPVTEGEFTLQIEETPPPPNDDFVNATVISAPVEEEPGGSRFYRASANGWNWTATKEEEEPPAAAGAAGLSVWYRWTAPGTGNAHIAVCCSSSHLIGIYRGSGPGALEVLSLGPALPGKEMPVSEGETFYIGIDSPVEESTGEPDPGFFQVQIQMELPPLPPDATTPNPFEAIPAPDTTAPQTTLVKSRLQAATRSATFWFSSSEAGGFLCRLDAKPFKPCTSPKGYRHLKPGRHTFRVKALDAAGNADASPVVAHFRLPSQRKRHGR